MAADPRRSARLKIERAVKQVKDLKSAIRRFRDSKPYKVMVDQKTESVEAAILFSPAKRVPDSIPLIFGDAIHNLRAALDHAVYAFVPAPTAHTAFPIYDTEERFKNALAKGKIAQARHEVLSHINACRADVRTYEKLLALHDLDIRDKHKLILTALGRVYLPAVEIVPHPPGIPTMHIIVEPFPLENQEEVELAQLPRGHYAYLHGDIERTVEIMVGEGRFAGQSVLDTITELADVVRYVVAGFPDKIA